MRRMLIPLCLVSAPLLVQGVTASAVVAQEAPRVVADIAPIRALVAQIMEGVGTPSQLIPTGASPHGYAMRPSEARALGEADLVVWVGPGLTHWLEEPLDSLSADAVRLTLMEHAGTQSLPMREAEVLEAESDHDHDHDHDKADKADDHAGHDHAGHDHHGDVDPHGWLSPSNAVLWSGLIAHQLGQIDPANAATYDANWNGFRTEMETLEQELGAMLAPYRDTSFIVLHDAFHYFEATFGVEAEAFIVPGDGSAPGPARMKALRDHLAKHPATCAFTAPQENEALLMTAIEGQGTRVAMLDPMGDGELSYATLLRQFAQDMVTCFKGE